MRFFVIEIIFGEIPERPNGTDCKSVVLRLRRFESSFPHRYSVKNQFGRKEYSRTHTPGSRWLCGSSSAGRASAFQAEGRGFESRLPLFEISVKAFVAQL